MSSPNASGDPRTGRDRRAPTRARTFQDGKVDPVITNTRPLLTIGNGVLLVVGIGYGMYATGHLPQLDAFFNHADEVGKANNSTVVNALITYGSVIVGCVLLALVGLVVFSIVNTHRRRASDPKGWEKEAKAGPERRKADRRQQEDLPSLIMPIGKERPERLRNAQPATAAPADAVAAAPVVADPVVTPAAAVAATPAPTPIIAEPAVPPQPSPVIAAPAAEKPSPAKLAAMEAAKKAEAAADSAPPDLPSFVLPYGKAPKPVTKVMKVQEPKAVPAAPAADAVLVTAPTPAPPTPVQAPSAEVAAANARADAAIAAARAAALKAEAAVAAAKAEAAIAIAKAEAAAAEAAIAAAKAEVQPV